MKKRRRRQLRPRRGRLQALLPVCNCPLLIYPPTSIPGKLRVGTFRCSRPFPEKIFCVGFWKYRPTATLTILQLPLLDRHQCREPSELLVAGVGWAADLSEPAPCIYLTRQVRTKAAALLPTLYFSAYPILFCLPYTSLPTLYFFLPTLHIPPTLYFPPTLYSFIFRLLRASHMHPALLAAESTIQMPELML